MSAYTCAHPDNFIGQHCGRGQRFFCLFVGALVFGWLGGGDGGDVRAAGSWRGNVDDCISHKRPHCGAYSVDGDSEDSESLIEIA